MGKTWTSIAILCNPNMGLHRDLMNLKGYHQQGPILFMGRAVPRGYDFDDDPAKADAGGVFRSSFVCSSVE